MKKTITLGVLLFLVYTSCSKDLLIYQANDLKIEIQTGSEWKHSYPIMLGIKKKNPPQIAIWTEDMDGNYIETLYVSYKIATQSWQKAGGNRRKELLPHLVL